MGRPRSRSIALKNKNLIVLIVLCLIVLIGFVGHNVPISSKTHSVCPGGNTFAFRIITVQLGRTNYDTEHSNLKDYRDFDNNPNNISPVLCAGKSDNTARLYLW